MTIGSDEKIESLIYCVMKYKVLMLRTRAKKVHFLRTPITVTKSGVGKYVGFQIEGDGNFFAPDFTVWRDSVQ